MASSDTKLWLLRFSVYYPKTVIGLVVLMVICASLFIHQVQLKLDASSLIPTDNPELLTSKKAGYLFQLRDVVVIGVVNNQASIYNPGTLRRIMRLSNALAQVTGIQSKSIVSLATVPTISTRGGKLDVLPVLSEAADLNPEAIQIIRRKIELAGLDNGILVASDGSAAGIFAEVEAEADRYLILKQVRELVKQEECCEDSIHLSGTALAQAILGESSAIDIVRLIPAVIIVLAGVLILAFRNLAPVLISLSEIAASLLLTIGLMGALQQSIFITTLVLPVILIAIGVSDDIYAMTRYFDETRQSRGRTEQEVIVSAFTKILKPISLTATSTVIGLLSLAVTGIQPLRVFGIFGALAVLFSSLFTFTLVPAMLVMLKPRLILRTGKRTQSRRAMLRLVHCMTVLRPWRILLLMLAAAVCAGLLGLKVSVDDNWIKNLPQISDIAKGDGELNNLLAGTTTVELMVDSNEAEGFTDPENFKALGAIEDAVAEVRHVGAAYSIFTDVVRVNAALRNMSYDDLRSALRIGKSALNKEEIEQALLLLTSSRRSPQGSRLAYGFERARLTIFIRCANYERIGGVLSAVSAARLDRTIAGLEITPFGDGWVSYLTVQLLVKGQIYSIALALLTDLALLSLLFKSIRAGVTAILPVGFSLLIVFAVLAATKTPLGIANSMFVGIAMGIGLDFSIHLTSAYQQGGVRGLPSYASLLRAVVSTGPAIITSAIAISAGFSVLVLSEITPNVELGLMISLSLLVCAAATLLLVPGIALLRREEG